MFYYMQQQMVIVEAKLALQAQHFARVLLLRW